MTNKNSQSIQSNDPTAPSLELEKPKVFNVYLAKGRLRMKIGQVRALDHWQAYQFAESEKLYDRDHCQKLGVSLEIVLDNTIANK